MRSKYCSHRLVFEKGEIIAVKDPKSPALMAPTDICPRRLIDTQRKRLVEFRANDTIPPYAILSHRWAAADEVVYSEFIQPRTRRTLKKPGYHKIQAICRQARKDGIRYIWIDTCCIKGNHEEVVGDVTSMYAYYQNAQVCYVYLVDVQKKSDMFSSTVSEVHGSGSEWFNRGWTLQELLAPRTVIFFNKDWSRIGDKHKLRRQIHKQTTIPPAILSGKQSIREVNVLTRVKWGLKRRTTKLQDQAYCLQGLLGVSVKLDYNENPCLSFNRLGKVLFDAHPELKSRLGISDDLFQNCDFCFLVILHVRSLYVQLENNHPKQAKAFLMDGRITRR